MQLDSDNPPLLLDPVDVELARQRPIAAAPTPAVAELEPLAAADELVHIYRVNAGPEALSGLLVELESVWA